ncbi:bisanhydrobacterioruberin hydratase [Haloglomus halophilum]|uniref:bisanhydrobacterioruberin hydratase n=1 Tax=Haloglomus halophilum TaxID=2962672 RepID=UPI002574EDC8|nr:bisanhydrobacterioruberin hydratase [Haloglomus halophilum]
MSTDAISLPGRARVEAGLDDLVRENRFTIAVVFPLMGAVLLVASRETLLPGVLNFNPYLIIFGTLVMRLPLVAGLAPLVGRRAAAGLLLLTAYSYGIEYVGVLTGFPYGSFEYGVDLGPMLLDTVPLGLPVFFFPLVVNAYLLCLLLLGPRTESALVRLPAVIAVVLLMDLVLDPGAVALTFWTYDPAGAYYGVPWSNYAGWVLSATVAVGTLDAAFERSGLRQRLRDCEFMLDDLVSFVVLWGLVNAYFGNWVPVALAGLLGAGLLATDRFDFDVRPSWPSVRG